MTRPRFMHVSQACSQEPRCCPALGYFRARHPGGIEQADLPAVQCRGGRGGMAQLARLDRCRPIRLRIINSRWPARACWARGARIRIR